MKKVPLWQITRCFSSVANRLLPCPSSASSSWLQQYPFHQMDQEHPASSVWVSPPDAGIDVMEISRSSVTCPNTKGRHVGAFTRCISPPASKLMWKL